jgi:hypothetical protein
MDRKKIHELLDLILEIQERGKGKDGYPYVNIEFSNYGSRILLCAQENGFVANRDYDLFDNIATDKQLDDAIVLAKVLLEKAVDMVGK